MFENIGSFFKKIMKTEQKELLVDTTSKDAAKERLHIVLMQDRANVSADFLELMKQEIIDVIKKYIVIDEEQIDVRLTNQENEDGTTGAPSLYANIPILNIRNDIKGEYLNQDGKIEVKKEETESNENNDTSQNTPIETQEEKNDITSNEINKNSDVITEVANNKNEENYYDDEDDNDVTFDDLLKAAEEEERNKKLKENNTDDNLEDIKNENLENNDEKPKVAEKNTKNAKSKTSSKKSTSVKTTKKSSKGKKKTTSKSK